MISTRRGFILLHVPKTAGNSIQHLLAPHSDDELVVRGHQDGTERFEIQGLSPHKHATLAEYRDVVEVTRYKVAITVREPLARAVSMFFSPHRWYRRHNDQWVLERPVWNRAEFLRLLPDIMSASDFLTLDGVVREPDFLIRYERLRGDLSDFSSALGLASGEPPHVNRSAGSAHQRSLAMSDPIVMAAVRERFQEDYRRFGYAEPFVTRGLEPSVGYKPVALSRMSG